MSFHHELLLKEKPHINKVKLINLCLDHLIFYHGIARDSSQVY